MPNIIFTKNNTNILLPDCVMVIGALPDQVHAVNNYLITTVYVLCVSQSVDNYACERFHVGIRYAKSDVRLPSRHDAFYDGSNWIIHEFFDWYQERCMPLCWTYSACVLNFSFLSKDTLAFRNNNLGYPVILEVLDDGKKCNRSVLQLTKNYQHFLSGGSKWRAFREMFCYAFGKA